MSKYHKISDAGRKALRDDTQMDPEDRLMLEICSRMEFVTIEMVMDIADAILASRDNDPLKAVEALKNGEITLEPILR